MSPLHIESPVVRVSCSLLVRSSFVLALAGGGACHRPGDEDLGLQRVPEQKIALDQLTDPRALVAAVSQPGAGLDQRLSARGFDLTRTLEIGAHDAADRTDDVVHFDSDGKGGFSLIHDLEHPQSTALAPARGDGDTTREKVDPRAQGMAAIALPGRLFVRARYGRYAERRPEPGELDRLRALGEQLLADDLALLSPWLLVTDQGEGSLEGRRTHRLGLGRRGSAAGMPKEDDPRRAWRATVEVSELRGELVVDAVTGALLAGRLDARYTFLRGGERVPVHVVANQTARAPSLFAAPPDALPNPHRPRPTVERNQLLEGLAPLAGTQGARPQ